ncbi:SLC13 family permease [Streptomyces mutabilis]|uniref:Dicarboxylate carrier MatC N-terminal domain-containing protein n=1 Tax=Streptomyces mutabilis TaxID=67332 RepID=A0A086MQG0_9ACTN|nr:SLC13 family permease [Streptomyces mutabilis]KFG71128.1 hypothetical protein FM21_00015 [Streptomyces mutabilis]
MDSAILSISVLAALFLLSFTSRFSLMMTAFPAAFLVAQAAEVPVEDLLGFFPADFFVLLVGVTAFFAVVQVNGTFDWLLDGALRLVGGRVIFFPPLIFAVGVGITAVGTLPAAGAVLLAPVTLRFASRHGLPALAMVVIMYNGIIAGMFSPIAVYGASFPRLLENAGIALPAGTTAVLLAASIGSGVVIAGIAMATIARANAARANTDRLTPAPVLAGAGVPSTRQAHEPGSPSDAADRFASPDAGLETGSETDGKTDTEADRVSTAVSKSTLLTRTATLAALVFLIVGALFFDIDLGFLSLILAFALQLLFRVSPAEITNRIPWGIVLLVSGIMTYVALAQSLGGFDKLSDALMFEGSPELSLLAICFVVGLTSFFISSIAVLTASVPLIVPLVEAGVSPLHAAVAVGLSAVLVDLNPLGLLGGILMGSAPDDIRPALFRHMLTYGAVAIFLGPFFAWAAFTWL